MTPGDYVKVFNAMRFDDMCGEVLAYYDLWDKFVVSLKARTDIDADTLCDIVDYYKAIEAARYVADMKLEPFIQIVTGMRARPDVEYAARMIVTVLVPHELERRSRDVA
jgi:hypothetical protein